jgi:hypothetical protein
MAANNAWCLDENVLKIVKNKAAVEDRKKRKSTIND